MSIDLNKLRAATDWEHGRISPSIHFDEDIYRLERERVFGRSWLVVGHEGMIPRPGDYITNYLGEVPVIVSRGKDGNVYVLLNRCAHRGLSVCPNDRGNIRVFTCPYHGWTYDSTGRLASMPRKDLYGESINRSEWGLEKISVATFHGVIFANLDSQAPSLTEWLGEDVLWWLENIVLAVPIGGLEALPGFHKYRSRVNWKLIAENFIGDQYHVRASTHLSWFQLFSDMAEQASSVPMLTWPGISLTPKDYYEGMVGYGRGLPFGMGLVSLGDAQYEEDLESAERLGPESVEWVRERHHRFSEALARREIKPAGFMNGMLFPNWGVMGNNSPLLARHQMLFHPRGPVDHEVWQWTLVEKDAPAAVKQIAVQRVYQGQYMAGLIAPDDNLNFERVVDGSESPQSWRRPYHYGLQLGREKDGPAIDVPGMLGPFPTEANQRQFYRFWLELMQRERSLEAGA